MSRKTVSELAPGKMGSATRALEFLDPVLAGLSQGVDLVRVLLDPAYQTEPVQLESAEGSRAVQRIVNHHLQPQLAVAVQEGRVVVSDAMRHTIESLAMDFAMRTLTLEQLAVEVHEILSSVDVEFLVLKGVATGRLDHGDPVSRRTSDFDILVRPDTFDRCVAALSDAGFALRSDPDLLDKGEAWESSAGVVDLHTRPHTAGRSLDEYWWATSQPLKIAGREFRALSRAGRMAHAASHYSVSYPNHRIMTSLLDLLVISRGADDADRAGAERFLAGLGVSDLTARITTRAAVLIGDERVLLGQVGSGPLNLMLRRAYDRPDLDLAAIKVAKTFGMPWHEKVTAIRRLVAPTHDYLVKGGYSSRTDRWVTLVRRRRD